MKKITISLLAILFIVPSAVSGASVTIDAIPTVCSSAVFRGTASYTVPETLHVILNGSSIGSFVSGDSSWQITYTGTFQSVNTLTVEVRDTLNAVIANTQQSFSANCGNNNPDNVTQVWGLTGHQTPKVVYGMSVTDEWNYTEECTYFWGCFDISRTQYYRLHKLASF